MAETMILIPGRSNKQGTSLNKGKLKEEYLEITSTVEMNQDDMKRLGIENGDEVRLSNEIGTTVVRVKADRAADGLIAFAKREGITHVIFGQTARSRWEILFKGSTLHRFLQEVRETTVHVVPLSGETPAVAGTGSSLRLS